MTSTGAAPRTPRRRPLLGVLAAAAASTVVAVPAFWTGVFAYASFSGCFLECGEPDPGAGLVWSGLTLLLLAFPVTVGLLVGGAGGRRRHVTRPPAQPSSRVMQVLNGPPG